MKPKQEVTQRRVTSLPVLYHSIMSQRSVLPVHFLGLPGLLPCIPSLQPKFSSQNSANQTFLRLLDRERLLKYRSKAGDRRRVALEPGRRPIRASVQVRSRLTVHRRPLGEDGDGALGHPLLLHHRRDLGAPAVRPHPQEVTCQVVASRRIQDPPISVTGRDVSDTSCY